ncbi:hypothetical protein [Taibaiella helva]|uniref:hypothetical protein n=1 Tax=Taibaiella helva TaxID=2301235 RepID=UPI000E58564B|nr:hypothetical protein [Taibaiella helva]
MRLRSLPLFLATPLFLFSCKSGFEHNRAGMEKLNKELKEEFNAEAWYTSVELANSGGSDDVVTIDMTKDPNSLKQEQWSQFHGFWDKKADITLSIQGAEPKSFMFQLDKEVSLGKLGDLMEASRKQLAAKGADDAQVILAQIKASTQMNTKEEGIYYSISFESKKQNKSYNFVYNLDGSLRKLNE